MLQSCLQVAKYEAFIGSQDNKINELVRAASVSAGSPRTRALPKKKCLIGVAGESQGRPCAQAENVNSLEATHSQMEEEITRLEALLPTPQLERKRAGRLLDESCLSVQKELRTCLVFRCF